MEVVFLGTASCYPTKHRAVSCTALKFQDGDVWLFDCGEGSQIQFQKSSLHPMRVKKIFITHLHGDHLFGLPGFLCTLGTLDRTQPFTLEIFGPLGLRRYVRESLNISRSALNFKYIVHEIIPLEDQYPEDIKTWRINEDADSLLHPQEILGNQIHNTGNSWTLFQDEHASVKAGSLVHRIPSFGFVIQGNDSPGKLNTEILASKGLKPGPLYGQLKSGLPVVLENGETIHPSEVLGPPIHGFCVTVLGDTKDSTGMTDIAMESDLVIHEATLEDSMQDKALENGHSTPKMAVDFAHKINAKRLVLFHFSQRYKLEEDPSVNILLKEAQESIAKLDFNCEVNVAYDLMEMSLSRGKKKSVN